MGKAEPKTKPTRVSVTEYIAGLPDVRRRDEAKALDTIYQRITGQQPRMWGPSIIGYGSYDYRYESGRSGTMCKGGFSPRKAALTLYLAGSYGDRQADADDLLSRLGKHSTGKSCLYVKHLADVDVTVLEQLIALSWERMDRYTEEQLAKWREKA